MRAIFKILPAVLFVFGVHTGVAFGNDAKPTSQDTVLLQQCFETIRDVNANLQQGEQPASRNRCIGVASAQCMDNPIGASTSGMVECISRETSWWDGLLNDYYQTLKGNLSTPLFGDLRDVQRKWIAYKDAACQFEYDSWDGGSIRRPAAASCFLNITAARALKLGELVERVTGR